MASAARIASDRIGGYAEVFSKPRFSDISNTNPMLHHFGITLQIAAMIFLPLLILYQLNFGFQLIVMPVCTVIGIVIFFVGTRLREMK
jgi:hypothetical protein